MYGIQADVRVLHKHRSKVSLTERHTWLVAFTFGLVHGLGFAGALSQVGLPDHAIPLALLMFNIGVECGQILFLGAVLAIMALWVKLPIQAPKESWRLMPYATGGAAAYWTIERAVSIV